MTYLSLHLDMDQVHKFVAARLRLPGHGHGAWEALREWESSPCGQTALPHASGLLQAATKLVIFPLQPEMVQETTPTRSPPWKHGGLIAEAPHIAVSIYSASLLLWVSDVIKDTQHTNAGHNYLEGGVHLLSHLNSRMARKLCRTLIRLHSTPHNR
ncbi:hypothetical protein GQ53DRAFT_755939 [Thozetella sp. PMI_491]|nr:hypothetical protein GQ53DRAFT_755939 [Thozetella sp. PMI_491]